MSYYCHDCGTVIEEAAEWTIRRTQARLSGILPQDVIDFDLLTGRRPHGLVLE
jgi:hypothetical protein